MFRFIFKLLIKSNALKKIIFNLSKKSYGFIENFNYNPRSNGEFWLIKVLSKESNNQILLDVGANVGNWALEAARHFTESKIYSIEASPSTYKELIKRTRDKYNIFSFSVALSDAIKDLTFYERGDLGTRNTLHGENTGIEYDRKYPIKTSTGDIFVKSHISKLPILFIKIDVEDHELHVLRGFSDLLKRKMVDVVQFERATAAGSYKMLDFYNLFNQYGYVLGKLYPEHIEIYQNYAYTLEEYIGCNWVAINPDSSAYKHLYKYLRFYTKPPRRI